MCWGAGGWGEGVCLLGCRGTFIEGGEERGIGGELGLEFEELEGEGGVV